MISLQREVVRPSPERSTSSSRPRSGIDWPRPVASIRRRTTHTSRAGPTGTASSPGISTGPPGTSRGPWRWIRTSPSPTPDWRTSGAGGPSGDFCPPGRSIRSSGTCHSEPSPNEADTHWESAILLVSMGRVEEARARVRRAIELDPLNSFGELVEGLVLWNQGPDLVDLGCRTPACTCTPVR